MIDYKKIASNYNIIVHQVEIGDENCVANGVDAYLNSPSCAGHFLNSCTTSSSSCVAEIWIGIYDNKDEEIASFFHELGHCITTIADKFDNLSSNDSFNLELDAWMVGLVESYKYGYLLPRSCFDFMINSIKSYDNNG
jgi:hypothetical protein